MKKKYAEYQTCAESSYCFNYNLLMYNLLLFLFNKYKNGKTRDNLSRDALLKNLQINLFETGVSLLFLFNRNIQAQANKVLNSSYSDENNEFDNTLSFDSNDSLEERENALYSDILKAKKFINNKKDMHERFIDKYGFIISQSNETFDKYKDYYNNKGMKYIYFHNYYHIRDIIENLDPRHLFKGQIRKDLIKEMHDIPYTETCIPTKLKINNNKVILFQPDYSLHKNSTVVVNDDDTNINLSTKKKRKNGKINIVIDCIIIAISVCADAIIVGLCYYFNITKEIRYSCIAIINIVAICCIIGSIIKLCCIDIPLEKVTNSITHNLQDNTPVPDICIHS